MSNAETVRKKLNELAERSDEISRREITDRKTVPNKEYGKETAFEKKWRDLGVLGLFEELRDEGVVTMEIKKEEQQGFLRKKIISIAVPATIHNE